MINFFNKIRVLNANAIKFLAAAFMLADHIGFLWNIPFLRILGRISMPLFAYMIAEGCAYTRNKLKHFLMIFLLGAICQLVYAIVSPNEIYLSILITFSISILLVYSLQYFKNCLFCENVGLIKKILSGAIFFVAVALTYYINQISSINGKTFYIDYGFWGCMLPVFASLFDFKRTSFSPQGGLKAALSILKCVAFSVGVVLLCNFSPLEIEWYALISLPILAIYNGEKGKLNTKYFFYVFYPLHLAILYGLCEII